MIRLVPGACIAMVILAFVASAFQCQRPVDCSRYRQGKFVTNTPRTGDKIVIDRNDSLQIETNTRTGEVIVDKITWANECEYELLTLSYQKSKTDKVDTFFMQTPVKVKIVSGTEDYYVFSIRVDSAAKSVQFSDTLRFYK